MSRNKINTVVPVKHFNTHFNIVRIFRVLYYNKICHKQSLRRTYG
jgi:hypothetical protein